MKKLINLFVGGALVLIVGFAFAEKDASASQFRRDFANIEAVVIHFDSELRDLGIPGIRRGAGWAAVRTHKWIQRETVQHVQDSLRQTLPNLPVFLNYRKKKPWGNEYPTHKVLYVRPKITIAPHRDNLCAGGYMTEFVRYKRDMGWKCPEYWKKRRG